MSVLAIVEIAALNAMLLTVGLAVLVGVRGRLRITQLALLGGVAYLLGTTILLFLLMLEMLSGLRFGLPMLIGTSGVVVVAGALASRGRRASASGGGFRAGAAPTLVGALGFAAMAVYFEAAFRSARLEGLFEWDAMAFWVPKAKAIYYFGGFDPQFFTTLPGSSYPPFVPTLDATAFAFMHSVDPITLHVMYWCLLVGFFWAVAGLLAHRVPAVVLWATALLIAVTPVVVNHGEAALADMFLDYLVAVAALLLAMWLESGERWELISSFVLLSGGTMVKREGLLMALCLVAATALAAHSRRATLQLAVLFGAILVSTIPWRIWLAEHALAAQGPSAGYFGSFEQVGRAWPSLWLTLTVVFGLHWWAVLPWLVLVAIGGAVLAQRYRLALFAASYLLLGILACSWVTMGFPQLPITTTEALNPIVRLSGALVVPLAVVLPLLLAHRSRPHGEVPAA